MSTYNMEGQIHAKEVDFRPLKSPSTVWVPLMKVATPAHKGFKVSNCHGTLDHALSKELDFLLAIKSCNAGAEWL